MCVCSEVYELGLGVSGLGKNMQICLYILYHDTNIYDSKEKTGRYATDYLGLDVS